MDVFDEIRGIVLGADDRAEKARKLATAIRNFGRYRWVGLYDVGPKLVWMTAYSGPSAPAYPQFPATKGLTGAAIRDKRPAVVGDVRADPRYLTAFGSALSEIVIPIVDEKTGAVAGTIDVETEQVKAFSSEDQKMLEQRACIALPLWTVVRS